MKEENTTLLKRQYLKEIAKNINEKINNDEWLFDNEYRIDDIQTIKNKYNSELFLIQMIFDETLNKELGWIKYDELLESYIFNHQFFQDFFYFNELVIYIEDYKNNRNHFKEMFEMLFNKNFIDYYNFRSFKNIYASLYKEPENYFGVAYSDEYTKTGIEIDKIISENNTEKIIEWLTFFAFEYCYRDYLYDINDYFSKDDRIAYRIGELSNKFKENLTKK